MELVVKSKDAELLKSNFTQFELAEGTRAIENINVLLSEADCELADLAIAIVS